jgi:hypothetical protein
MPAYQAIDTKRRGEKHDSLTTRGAGECRGGSAHAAQGHPGRDAEIH